MENVLLVTTVPSPFQVELCKGINDSDSNFNFDIWFSRPLPPHRGQHWLSRVVDDFSYFSHHPINQRENISLERLLEQKEYSIAIVGLPMSILMFREFKSLLRRKIKIILWNEQPVPCSIPKKIIKDFQYKLFGKLVKPVSVFAIGDRAADSYSHLFSCPIHVVPYFQKLNREKHIRASPSNSISQKIRFLFSGQLIQRNNIENILKASQLLVDLGYSGKFVVEFFGKGPQFELVERNALKSGGTVVYSNLKIEEWDDRLKPFIQSDVLICPGYHSGWGLTIPEAMSFGLPVISSLGIESARFYVRDGLNGYLSGTSYESIAKAMLQFIDNPELVTEMSERAFLSSSCGDVSTGSFVFDKMISMYV